MIVLQVTIPMTFQQKQRYPLKRKFQLLKMPMQNSHQRQKFFLKILFWKILNCLPFIELM
ncbi:hypothetical protein B6K86_01935 [Lachnospiraceae bacterium]|nr:hypothetical protein B6K86_01935 [Lachnospiraceae bacterium]